MKYLYLKGMSASQDELDYIKSKFQNSDMDFDNLVDNYADFYRMSEDNILKELINKISQYDDVCLICHSMGCNFGVLVADKLPNLRKIIFVSPEWYNVSKEEQELITPSTNKDTYPSKQLPLSINKIKNIAMFIKSKKWLGNANMLFEDLKDLPKDVFYAKGDKYVSHKNIKLLSKYPNVEVFEVDTNNHNPILETDDVLISAKKAETIKSMNN